MGHYKPPIFHLAIPVTNLEATRKFYQGLPGCEVRGSSDEFVIFYFHGHHIIAHLATAGAAAAHATAVAMCTRIWHLGIVLDWSDFEAAAEQLRLAGFNFSIPPTVRNSGQPNEEAMLFLLDPSGNGIEYKTYRDFSYLYRDAAVGGDSPSHGD
jgi:hypothetical protein